MLCLRHVSVYRECILWVDRPVEIYYIQVVLAIISLLQTILMTVLSYKGNILQQLLKWSFIIEMITTVPWIVTVSPFISDSPTI